MVVLGAVQNNKSNLFTYQSDEDKVHVGVSKCVYLWNMKLFL